MFVLLAPPSENNGPDKLAAGKLLYGERHSKRTAADAGGVTQRALATQFGVAGATVSKILLGKAWTK
jgi:hypothetical protein